MNIALNLQRGLDLKVAGCAVLHSQESIPYISPNRVAINIDDFNGLTLKPIVKIGESVSKGSPILSDKHNPTLKITAPASGTIADITRGERRKLLRIIIDVDPNDKSEVKFESTDNFDKEEIISKLQTSGLWALIRQRPYNIVIQPNGTPRDIFISMFDSSPLAPDCEELLSSRKEDIETGVEILGRLTNGTVYIGQRPNGIISRLNFNWNQNNNVTVVDINGPHPAGNPGIQAANIKPVNKGETIWTLDGFTLARIGHLFRTGTIDTECYVAITGSEIDKPSYVRTIIGTEISELINGKLIDSSQHQRIISGNILTGVTVKSDGFLHFPYTQITVIPEGDDVIEFMGWASLSPKKMSINRSFPGSFLNRMFKPDARLNGGQRAIIMSGEYDQVIPMDILGEYLIKAIISKDIEKMEALGIYEVAPEDFALAEYLCTSKLPLQSIVASGLEYIRKELE